MLISRKRYKIGTYFQWKTNRKSYVAYRMAPVLVTLNDLEGHSPVAGLFKCNPSNTCAVFTRFQLTARSRGPWATAGLFVFISEVALLWKDYLRQTACVWLCGYDATFVKLLWPLVVSLSIKHHCNIDYRCKHQPSCFRRKRWNSLHGTLWRKCGIIGFGIQGPYACWFRYSMTFPRGLVWLFCESCLFQSIMFLFTILLTTYHI